MSRRPAGAEDGRAPNPAWVVSGAGEDLVRALAAADYAVRLVPVSRVDRAIRSRLISGDAAQPPLVIVDLRGPHDIETVRRLRRQGRVPVLAVADDDATAAAAVEAGANETLTTAELRNRLPELANYLIRMATLW